jgi:hypothetical protein
MEELLYYTVLYRTGSSDYREYCKDYRNVFFGTAERG